MHGSYVGVVTMTMTGECPITEPPTTAGYLSASIVQQMAGSRPFVNRLMTRIAR